MGATFDSGALIGLQRRTRRMRAVWTSLQQRGELITVPTVVLVECWGSPTNAVAELLALCEVEDLTEQIACEAAKARAMVGGNVSAVDAVVMASAASRGDIVYTGDYDDLARLRDNYFRSVKILSSSGPDDAQ
ncbi:MAG: PIN domain-containing protein [Byssovorax sp.]